VRRIFISIPAVARLTAMAVTGVILGAAPATAQEGEEVAEGRAAVERRPYLLLKAGLGAQSPAARGAFETAGGFHAAIGLGYPITPRLAVRGEYQRQWFFRGAEAVAPCVETDPCPRAAAAVDYQAAEFLLEGRRGSAADRRALAFAFVGAGLAWAAETGGGLPKRETPVGVVGLGLGRRSALRTERGVRLEGRYTVFGRDALGTRGLMSLALALWI